MTSDTYTVSVEKGLEDLIPTYLSNREQELALLGTALAARDFEQLAQLGHRMRGVGTPYGFDWITALGKRIQDAARLEDAATLDRCLVEYQDFLSRVVVVYS